MGQLGDWADNERDARLALAALTQPEDAVTGGLLATVGAVGAVRLLVEGGPLPGVDPIQGELWRRKMLVGDPTAMVD